MDKGLRINRKEVLRYLGYRNAGADETALARIDQCSKEAINASEPKFVCKEFALRFKDADNTDGSAAIDFLDDGGSIVMSTESANLHKNLFGCERAILLAVTVGIGIDRLIARANIVSMADAAIYQAVGASLVESYCNDVNAKIKADAEERGYYVRARFSPGYGDFALEHQRNFERLLDMPKTAGISLSGSLLMTPSKSITAVIGLSKTDRRCTPAGCYDCNLRDSCEFSYAD